MANDDFDESIFEDEDFCDEDFAEIDALIEELNSLPRLPVSILNLHRVHQMRFSCAMMKRILRETNSRAWVECKQHEHNCNVGVVRIEGVELSVTDMEGFARAAEFASNTEVYPLKDNSVRLTFTFHDLARPLA